MEYIPNKNHKSLESEVDESDEDIEGNDHAYEKEVKILFCLYQLHNIESPSVSPAQVLNKALAEGQNPVSLTTEPSGEVLAFLKDFSYGIFHFGNATREIPITRSQYIHDSLKCFDNTFARSTTYIPHNFID